MQGDKRRRRGAIDCETTEEYMKMAILSEKQLSLFYDEKKHIMQCIPDEQPNKQFVGFEHSCEYLSNDSEGSLEELLPFNIMVICEATSAIRGAIVSYCEGSQDSSQECINVCLDIVVKRRPMGKGLTYLIRFILFEPPPENKYAKLVEIYLKKCHYFLFVQTKVPMDALWSAFDRVVECRGDAPVIFFLSILDEGVDLELVKQRMGYRLGTCKKLINIHDFLDEIIELVVNNQKRN